MLLALVFFAGSMFVIGIAAWMVGSKSQMFQDETDWDERLMRPRPQQGFENLSAADLELTEIEIMEDLAIDDLGNWAPSASSGFDDGQ